MRSTNALDPCLVPSWSRSFARKSALRVSAPPPFPKIEPMNAVTAIASFTVQGGVATSMSSKAAVTPSAYAWRSLRICLPLAP